MTIAVNRNLSNCENSPKKRFFFFFFFFTSLDFIVEGKTILTDEGFLYAFYVSKGKCEN